MVADHLDHLPVFPAKVRIIALDDENSVRDPAILLDPVAVYRLGLDWPVALEGMRHGKIHEPKDSLNVEASVDDTTSDSSLVYHSQLPVPALSPASSYSFAIAIMLLTISVSS